MTKKYSVAIVGATGLVGQEMLSVLAERAFPVGELTLLASERSDGEFLEYNGEEHEVQTLTKDSFKGVDIALFSAGGSISKEFAPAAARSGAIVVDNTSAFRMEEDIPLIVPEVNPEAVSEYKKRGIIANPNCSTIQMVVALKPIHDAVRIKRVVVSTYQSVSGAGRKAMEELSEQSRSLMNGRECVVSLFPHRIAFNCIPQIGKILENGYSEEEIKMINETKKILGDSSIRVSATTVRVPVFCAHSESVNIETHDHISAAEVKALLSKTPGIMVIDDPTDNAYPIPSNTVGKDPVFVGRIRGDSSVANGIDLWIVSDNLRKGAALNAVQIAEILVEKYL